MFLSNIGQASKERRNEEMIAQKSWLNRANMGSVGKFKIKHKLNIL